jgi:hypothetical protein
MVVVALDENNEMQETRNIMTDEKIMEQATNYGDHENHTHMTKIFE